MQLSIFVVQTLVTLTGPGNYATLIATISDIQNRIIGLANQLESSLESRKLNSYLRDWAASFSFAAEH